MGNGVKIDLVKRIDCYNEAVDAAIALDGRRLVLMRADI